jgi:anti-anti-sigma factor
VKGREVAEHTYHLRGEYDLANSYELEADLLHFAHRSAGGPLTVDAQYLRFIDSSGINALLRVREVLASEGRRLRVVNLPSTAERVLEILGLDDTLGVVNAS